MPGKLSEQKIEMEIINMNNEINAKTRTDLTKKKAVILGLFTLLIGAFDEESIHALYIMLVSIVLAI